MFLTPFTPYFPPQWHCRAAEHFLHRCLGRCPLSPLLVTVHGKDREMHKVRKYTGSMATNHPAPPGRRVTEENWAISVAASCTVLSDGQGDRANFQSHWDGESCELPGIENATHIYISMYIFMLNTERCCQYQFSLSVSLVRCTWVTKHAALPLLNIWQALRRGISSTQI